MLLLFPFTCQKVLFVHSVYFHVSFLGAFDDLSKPLALIGAFFVGRVVRQLIISF